MNPKELIGMTEEDAIKKARSEGVIIRVAGRDDILYLLNRNRIPKRINVYIKNGIVSSFIMR